jgi:hypothetical protein
MVGLGSVDNTADASKPVSTATQTALDGKAATIHTHGSISSSGTVIDQISTAIANPVAFGGLVGNIGRGAWGTESGTFCQGNDSRLSNARTPTAHTQAWSTITSTPTTLSGYGIADAVSSSDARLTDAREPTAHNQAWSTITSKPTTLSGYGITDAVGSSDARLTDARTPLSHTHNSSAITDFSSAVAAASPEEVVEYTTAASFPATGNGSLLYLATDSARAYRWVGSQYAEVGPTSVSVSALTGIAPGSSGSPAISSSVDSTTGFYFPSSGNISVVGNLGIGTGSPSTNLDINSNKFRIRTGKTPTSANDTGNAGDICWDSNYIYVCTATNSWLRTQINPWSNDSYFSNVSLLLHMNGSGSTFVDNSSSPKTIAVVGVGGTQSITQRKFGSSSLQLTAGSHLSVNGGDAFRFGTGDFVVELFAYPTQTPNGTGLISSEYYSSSQVGFTIAFSNSGTLGRVSGDALFAGFFSSGSWKGIASASSLTLNSWNHIAVSRISGTYRLFLNGVLLGTLNNSSVLPDVQPLRIGRDWSGESTSTGSFVGYIDEVRITKGSGRGYEGDAIPVPTEPFADFST